MILEHKKFIEENGLFLESNLGVKEWALDRKNSLILLDLLEKAVIPCKGGDVIMKNTNEKLEYTDDNWYYDKDVNDSVEVYMKKSIAKAREYIENYPEKNNFEYYYVIVGI